MNELLIIEGHEISLRLDQILTQRFEGHYSRTYFQDLIKNELVLVNGESVKKRHKPKEGDEIEIEFAASPEVDLQPENIPLNILYEDEDLIAINKPPGMVVHPAPGHWSGTFVNALVFHCQELLHQDDKVRPGIVHRLDKDTSGVLIAAKNSESQRRLIEAFATRQVVKEYVALVSGNPGKRWIDAPIGRSPTHRQKMAVVSSGKPARTHVETKKTGKLGSFIHVLLETGRTHQIRVHLSSIGSPILGDSLYGHISLNQRLNVSRQLLHAKCLQLMHPLSGKPLKIEAPLPDDIVQWIGMLT